MHPGSAYCYLCTTSEKDGQVVDKVDNMKVNRTPENILRKYNILSENGKKKIKSKPGDYPRRNGIMKRPIVTSSKVLNPCAMVPCCHLW